MGSTTQPPVEQGVIIANILPTLKGMPEILQDHQVRAAKGVAAATALADLCEPAEKITEEMDTKCKDMIIKLNGTVEKFEDTRKPFTQMIGEIVKAFTGTEAILKAPVVRLQAIRNRRAKEVLEENKRREAEAAALAAKNKERAELVGHFSKAIATCLNNKLFERKNLLTTNFNAMTLADIEERGAKLKILFNLFPTHKLAEIIIVPMPIARLHAADEVKAIYDEVYNGYDLSGFYTHYQNEMDQVKQGLVDRLPSKLAELQEAERQRLDKERMEQEAEAARLAAAERARQARLIQEGLDRQAAAAKSEADRKRIAAEQAAAAEREKIREQEEAARQAALAQQQEAQRIENDRLAAQQEARRKQEAQEAEDARIAADKKASDAAEQAKTTAIAQTLFDQSNAANMKEAEGETRKGWEITVLGPAGWAEIFQYWFLNGMAEQWKKDADKIGAITFDKMKKFCEKVADKTKIESEFLDYRETVTAVNRKEKKGA
jgi:hypothetical protein